MYSLPTALKRRGFYFRNRRDTCPRMCQSCIVVYANDDMPGLDLDIVSPSRFVLLSSPNRFASQILPQTQFDAVYDSKVSDMPAWLTSLTSSDLRALRYAFVDKDDSLSLITSRQILRPLTGFIKLWIQLDISPVTCGAQ